MSKEKYEVALQKIKKRNESRERKRKLKEEKRKYWPKFKLPSTSKIVLMAVFLLCIEIVLYCEYAMIVLGDASAMYVLIGVPTTLVPTVLAYYKKSQKENTLGGITYDMAMLERGEDCCDFEDDESNA